MTGVAPSGFSKYMTISALSGLLNYTIAFNASSTTLSGAAMAGLPTTPDADVTDAFAFHIDATSGLLRYEGRFGDSNKRHMRMLIIGALNTAMSITNVETLRFVQGENFGTSGGGLTVSVDGTPSAGRRVRILSAPDMSIASPVWTAANADDQTCVGETAATCTGNSGIVPADQKFFFADGSGYTAAKAWFLANSFLGTVSNTVDMEDIWN